MAVNVYIFPPVAVLGTEWTEIAPVSRSKSIMSGKRYVSAAKRKRRSAGLEVSSLGGNKSGAGYCENLKMMLSGGEHLVRLHSWPINWYRDAARLNGSRQAWPLGWQSGVAPLGWTVGAQPLNWYSGTVLTGMPTTDSGWPAILVSGLPTNQIVARPAEFITVFEDVGDTTGETVRVLAEAKSSPTGTAIIRLMTAVTHGGRVNIGVSETAVFEVVEMPRSVQPVSGDWSYDWDFSEVFEDEVEGGFVELNPWS